MRWRALFLVVLVAGCGRSSLTGVGGNDRFEMGSGPGDLACAGPRCAGDLGDMSGDECADKANCMKPECVGDPRCHKPGVEICNNGIDDDDNGLIDCADPKCKDFPGCQPHRCDPSHLDCTDPLCNQDPRCKDLKCHPSVDFGTLTPMGTTSTRMEDSTGTKDVAITPCAPGGAGMVVGEFTVSALEDVTLSWQQGKGEDHVFGLFRAGIEQGCGDNPITCVDPKQAAMGQHTFPSLGPGNYYLITQPFEPKGQGPLSLTLSTSHVKEICNNGIDDNGNGLIDCADADCINDPNCVAQECKPDFNVGALVVNDPPTAVSFDTSAADVENNLTCQGAPGGKDVVVRFTLHETAGILLRWDQKGDHVVGFMHTPDPGLQCDAQPIECYDPSGRAMDEVAWTEQPAGDYEFIFKALKPGTEGHVDAQISAYRTRPIELCHNGIDDDGNGLIDCADPACKGVAGCSGPYCAPNQQLGNLSVGEARTVDLNVASSGIAGYNTTCAKGGGKGMVVQLTVPQGGTHGGFGLGFQCSQTGDQVLDLFAAGGPRDSCDTKQLVCADPKTLPFGCGYVVPNLQPGTYNVIVEGFQAGSEGTMNLTLSVQDDRQLEICNNGIDDDNNGLIDCADPKCITSPYCTHAQCNADVTIDPMPLDGSDVDKVVQTQNAPVQAKPACESTAGGPTAVVAIRLTAKADLTLQWNQFGNHDFALYSETAAMLPCDAGTLVTCSPSLNVANGATTFSGVPAGRYYLVVAADTTAAAAAGSVALRLSGKPSP